jgi:hypothetical protein
VCGAGILQVVHQPGAPDQMACNNCQSVFQVEKQGAHVRFVELPSPLAAFLANRWVTVAEVKDAVKVTARTTTGLPPPEVDEAAIIYARLAAITENAAPPAETAVGPQSSASAPLEPLAVASSLAVPLTDGEVLAKAQALYRLGNSDDQIEAILRRNPKVTSEQIQAARAALVEERALKASRQQHNLYIAGGVALIIILCCIVAGFFSRSMTGLFGIINNPIPSSTQPADSQPLGPTPEIVREDANSVQPGVCPATRLEASKLFGGASTDWTGSKANGWTMLNSNLLTVRVPKGMKAVLVSGANLQTTTLIGPVLIKNVDAIKITCQ